MVIVSLILFLYFISLVFFSLVNNAVYYCGLLVINSILCSFVCYLVFGFSWYTLLFCLVYIGGIYILFIFVSVFNPNNSFVSYNNLSIISLFFVFFICGGVFLLINYSLVDKEFSFYLCSLMEGNFYILMCMGLIFGFVILSIVMSVKSNYYR